MIRIAADQSKTDCATHEEGPGSRRVSKKEDVAGRREGHECQHQVHPAFHRMNEAKTRQTGPRYRDPENSRGPEVTSPDSLDEKSECHQKGEQSKSLGMTMTEWRIGMPALFCDSYAPRGSR
jgi:hypothetical protein